MEALHNLNPTSLADTLLSLITAFVLGGIIGIERQMRQRTAGQGLDWPDTAVLRANGLPVATSSVSGMTISQLRARGTARPRGPL